MPIYEYECKECGVFEIKQGIFDDRLTSCINCDSPAKRIISKVNFIIKGPNASTGYASIPTNEELGLESETELLKRSEDEFYIESLKLGRSLTTKEREVYKEELKQQKTDSDEEVKRVDGLKKKHPEFTAQVSKSLNKIKSEPVWKKEQRKEQRKKENLRGTRKVKDSDFQGANLNGIGRSKIFKD